MIWHSSSMRDVLTELSVDESYGLQNGIAEERLENYGKNEIKITEKTSLFKRFLAEFKSKTVISLIIICFISVIISLVYSQPKPYTALILVAVLFVNAIISAFHLYSCDNTLDDIKSVSHPTVKVLREGIEKTISADCLVKGDIIFLSEGDFVCADARIIECNELRSNEVALTGDEVPVEKDATVILDDIVSLENRSNMIFAGTTIVHGTAKAVVVATGVATENGKTSLISEQIGSKRLPIEAELETIGKFVNIVILVVCLLVFAITLIQNLSSTTHFAVNFVNVILNSVTLAVAAIPKSLSAIATIVITIGMGRFLNDKIIIKQNNAFETIGKTNVIIADKTGVFTHKNMILSKVFDGKNLIELGTDTLSENGSILLRLGAICSTLQNDATEKAIKKACLSYNAMTDSDLKNLMPKIGEVPFDLERKSMSVITMINERPFAIVKGAPETVIPKCINCNTEEILKLNRSLAEEAYRIVCVAMRPLSEIPAHPKADDIEDNLTFVGLLVLREPIRNSVINEIEVCKKANIKTVMVTGDNLYTAKAIATQIGLINNDSEAITGSDIKHMTDAELIENIDKYSVFARVSPEDKLRIVKAWKSKKAIVTVTGDSLSDAESLAVADVGCALGQYGTDVAQGNADIIIRKNNFGSVVSAIKESRGFFGNIKKTVYYLCSCNFAELIAVFLGVCIFKMPIIAATQLLLINLLTDCAPAISFSMEKAENSVMRKKSFEKLRRILDIKSLSALMVQSIFIAVLTIVSFTVGKEYSLTVASTMAFATLGIAQGIHCFNNKFEGSIFNKDVFNNSFMNKSVFAVLFIIIFLVFTPIGFIFGLTILNFTQFIIALSLAALILPVSELMKYLKQKV